MDKQQVERMIIDKALYSRGNFLLHELTLKGVVATIVREHEKEIAKLKQEEQLAILPCQHSTVWADDDGCKACDYEKQIAKLIALLR